MHVSTWLQNTTNKLSSSGIPTARLDALVLLEMAMGVNRAQLLAHPEMTIPSDVQNVLKAQIERRAKHEPLAYVLGKTEFYGREFIITPAVLEPRPESETMIDLLKKLVRNESFGYHAKTAYTPSSVSRTTGAPVRLADVGTGSGALGITAKLELPELSVELLEIDLKAIKVAKRNVIKFATSISAIKSDLLANTSQTYDILLCNLPYVPDSHTINAAAMHEPKIAIFGGPDGLDLYRRLFKQLDIVRSKPLLILTESLPPQHAALKKIAERAGYRQTAEDDFIQAFQLR